MWVNYNFKIQTAPGAKIANCKGVPGTVGCFAYMRDSGQPVVLSNWHIMYGKEASRDDRMWLVEETNKRENLQELGRVLSGKIGIVRFHNWEVYVDCAICTCTTETTVKQKRFSLFDRKLISPSVKGHCEASIGDPVFKIGSVTGRTGGIVVDDRHSDTALIEGQTFDAKGQLLIRSENGLAFSAGGDSGAIIFNRDNKAVGLLWGTNCRGEGVACPIAPVLSVLNIDFSLPVEK